MNYAVCLLLLLVPISAHAAFEFRPAGARARGLGDTFVAQAEGAEAVFWNPASVAWGGIGVAGGYERPFGMAALETGTLGAALPLGRGAVGVGYQDYGFSLYREQAIGLMYGHRLSPRLGLGVGLRRLRLSVAGVEGRAWTAFDLGARVFLTRSVVLGLAAWNAGGAKVNLLGQGGMAGVGFTGAPGLTVLVDVRKEAGTPVGFSTGLEYRAGKGVTLRMGAGGRPERLSIGLGVERGVFRIDYAAAYHTVLGLSHRVSVTVER